MPPDAITISNLNSKKLEFLITQENKKKKYEVKKKQTKLPLFSDRVITGFLNNPRDSTNRLLDLRGKFSEMVGFKMNI